MKIKFKKVIAIIIFMIFIFATFGISNIYADTECTITIENQETGHEYQAFQVFTGDLSVDPTDSAKVLSNIEWGNGITDPNGFLADLKADPILSEDFTADVSSPREVAVILEQFYAKDSDKLVKFAEIIAKYLNTDNKFVSTEGSGSYTITVPKTGYYFIKDKDDSLDDKYSAYTRYMLKIADDITIEPKSEKPSVDKSLLEDSDKNFGDFNINEVFDFYLTATLKENSEYGQYEEYKLVFDDIMETGITYDKIVDITVKGAKTTDNSTIDDFELTLNKDYTETHGEHSLNITVTNLIASLKAQNPQADISKGLKVVVDYQAHLNTQAKISDLDTVDNPNVNTVKLHYSNNPNAEKTDDMGVTLEDKNFIFTYGVKNTKYERHSYETDDDNRILENAGFKLYKNDGETEIKLQWDSSLSAYYPVKDGEPAVDMMKSQPVTGQFNIIGLDQGTYILKEVDTPAGYDTCEPITIEIVAEYNETDGAESVIFTTKNNMNNSIVDIRGAKLPSTGSITLIVIFGVAIVLGISGIILSKKNKKKE